MTVLTLIKILLLLWLAISPVRPDTPKEILEYLNEQTELFKPNSEEEVIVMLGDTGSGKSTLTLLLTGATLKVEKRGKDYLIFDDYNKIGNVTRVSHTLVPDRMVYKGEGYEFIYYDCPGLKDTKSAKVDITISFLINKLLTTIKSFKLVLVVNYSSLKRGGNRSLFPYFLENVMKLLVNIDNYKNGIAIVATKVMKTSITVDGKHLPMDDATVIKNIANYLEEEENKTKTDNENEELSTEQRDFNTQKINLLKELQENDGGKEYKRIGIIRVPNDVGNIRNMSYIQDERSVIEIIISKLSYVGQDKSLDFRHVISRDSAVTALDFMNHLLSHDILNDVSNVCEGIKNHYEEQFQSLLDFAHLDKTNTEAKNKMSQISSDRLLPFAKKLREVTSDILDESLFESLEKHINYTKFLLKVHKKKLVVLADYTVKINDVTVYVESRFKHYVDKWIEDVLPVQSLPVIKAVCDDIDRHYLRYEKNKKDLYVLHEKLLSAHRNLSKVRFSDPQSLVNTIRELNITLSSQNLKSLSDMVNQMQSAQKFRSDLDEFLASSKTRLKITTKQLELASQWYGYVIEIYTDFAQPQLETDGGERKIMKDLIIKSNKANIKGKDLDLKRLSISIGKDYMASFEDVVLSQERKQALATILTRLTTKAKITCNDSRLNMTVTGNVVRTSEVIANKCWPNAQFIEIFALDSVIFDSSMDKKGMKFQMAIMAPVWAVVGNRRTLLKGSQGQEKDDAKDGDVGFIPVRGEDGEAGHSGGPGGNFLGIGLQFVGGSNLEVISEGGDGGSGQNGGKGSPGKPPVEKNHAPDYRQKIIDCYHPFTDTSECLIKFCTLYNYSWILNHYDAFDKPIIKSMYKKGYNGTDGGDGGNGGIGGYGGKSGHIVIIELGEPSKVRTTPKDGTPGTDGKGGAGGRIVNKTVISKLLITENTRRNPVSFEVPARDVIPRTYYQEFTKEGKKGNDGESSTKLEPVKYESGFYRPAHVVNKFKKFIIENLTGDFKESKLREFLKKMEKNTMVKGLYDVHGFVDELKSLELQYTTLRTESFFEPFYNSLFSRMNEYLKLRKLTSDEHEVFKYLSASVMSKLFSIKRRSNHRQIYDLDAFLGIVRREIAKLNEISAIDAINTYREEFEKSLDDEKKAADSLVQHEIMPEIEEVFHKMDTAVLKVIDTDITNERSTVEALVATKAKKDQLKQNLALRMRLAPLKMIGSVLAFCGPYGATAGAVIIGATSLYEVSNINNVEKIEHNPLSLKFIESVKRLNRRLNNELSLAKAQVTEIKKSCQECLNDTVNTNHNTKLECQNVQNQMIKLEADIKKIEDDTYKSMEKPNMNEIKKKLKSIADTFKNTHRSKRSARRSAKKVYNKIGEIAGATDMPVDLFNLFKEDADEIREVGEVIAEMKTEVDALQLQEQMIYKILVPEILLMKEQVESLDSLSGKSYAELSVQKWKVGNVLHEVGSLFNQMTQNFFEREEFQLCLAKIDAGISALIGMYDLMDSYADTQQLGRLFADVSSGLKLSKKIDNEELLNSVDYLKKVVHSNMVLDKYNQALRGIKQHYFPVVNQSFLNEQLPEGLKMVDMDSMTYVASEHIKALQKDIKEKKLLSSEYGNDMKPAATFDGIGGHEEPFYVWKHGTIEKQVKQLLSGKTVMLIADIRNGINQSVVKFRNIGLYFKLLPPFEDKQSELDKILEHFNVAMTLSGNNYYRCNNRIYYMPLSRNVKCKFRMSKDRFLKWRNPNLTFKKIRDNEAFLSPFAKWNITLSYGKFKNLKEFRNKPMDLQLIGYGTYLERRQFIGDVCNEQLDKHYTLDGIEDNFGLIGKKKFQPDPSCCPVCGVTVRPQDLEQHFVQELDRLYKVTSAPPRPRAPRSALPPTHSQDHVHAGLLHAPSAGDGTPLGRWETYKRIKANRQARIRIKNRKRKADEPACPVCSERLSGSPEELNQHVERCLNKQNGAGHHSHLDDEEVDVEGDSETFEEYEWAGQRRVRATSMLVGGFSAVGLATSSSTRSQPGGGSSNQEEEDVDLVVDGDDAAQFGAAQYSEADVVTPRLDGTREQKERDALREAVISPNAPSFTPPEQPRTPQIEVKSEPRSSTPLVQSNENDESGVIQNAKGGESDSPVIDALRGRIRELESETRSQALKCLICMEQYKKPVTSVCCWHVHCEQCWLHTLGAKKLCPQCNMITSPSDLRRIYM